MNFETKHFIRWGVPGWVFIMFMVLIYWIFNPDLSFSKSNVLKLIGFFISAGFIGVPIGYLFHQIYFSLNWLNSNNDSKRIFDKAVDLVDRKDSIKEYGWGDNRHIDYYRFEYVWHKELLKLPEDKRTYLSERYRYFLGTIHALGALNVSLVFSLVSTAVLFIYHSREIEKLSLTPLIVLSIFNAYLIFAVIKGFKYYSNNLNYFQGYFLNDLLNGEFIENKECTNNKKCEK